MSPGMEKVLVSVFVPAGQEAVLYRFAAQLLDGSGSPAVVQPTPLAPAVSAPPAAPPQVPPVPAAAPQPPPVMPPSAPQPAPAASVPDPNAQPSTVIDVQSVPARTPAAPTPEKAKSIEVVEALDVWKNCHNVKDVLLVIMRSEGRREFAEVLQRFQAIRASGLCKAASVIPAERVEQRVRLNWDAIKDSTDNPF